MKKILLFSLTLLILSTAVSAQLGRGRGLHKNQLTRFEKLELRKDVSRTLIMKKRAGRDGVVTPFERRRIHRSKCDTRRDMFRYRHNGRRRII